MALCIRERIFSWSETYDVTDEEQKQRYFVKGEVFSLGHKIHIYDEKHNEVAFVQEKVWSFLKKFVIYIHGEEVGVIKEKLSFFHSRYDVQFMDCQIEGDLLDWNYQMKRKEEVVGVVQRQIFSWANVFYLSYSDPKDELAVLALAIAVDAAHNDDETAMIASTGYYYH
jgi:uncharacterized protein YxjI